ncbi:LysR family transcriptional regulator [Marinomonas epiphytica]
MLNVQYLNTFKKLVETASFTETAKQLSITQPAVSQHIKKLEDALGQTLFMRHGRKVSLTQHGQLLLEHVLTLESCHSEFIGRWQTMESKESA